MEERIPDRRKHHAFRILYMDFKSFWERIILRKRAPQRPPLKPRPTPTTPATKPPDHGLKPSASTGIQKLDEQHHGIREAILKFQKELRDGSMHQPLPEALSALLQMMNEHFQYEEAYLEHIHVQDLPGHKAEHEQFRTQALHFQQRAEGGDPTVPLELSSFLFNWFRNHTLREEAGFAKGPNLH